MTQSKSTVWEELSNNVRFETRAFIRGDYYSHKSKTVFKSTSQNWRANSKAC